MAATIQDIATKAQVSIATVSRALNGKTNVTKETRDKVLAVARELNYIDSSQESKSALDENYIVTLSYNFELQSVLFNNVLAGITEICQASGYRILNYVYSTEDSIDPIIGLMNEGFFKGLILTEVDDRVSKKLQEIYNKDFIVQCCGYNPSLNLPYVITDNRKAAMKATEHLISLGHTKIGVLSYSSASVFCKERFRGFKEAMQFHGIPVKESWVYQVNSLNYEPAYCLAKSVLSYPDRPTAFFALTDYFALALVNAAKHLGIKIPEEVSVIGFDDLEVATLSIPGITTMRQNFKQMGSIGSSILLNAINGTPLAKNEYLLEADLIMRETTGVCLERG